MKKLFFSLLMMVVAIQAWAVAAVGSTFSVGDLTYRVMSTGDVNKDGTVDIADVNLCIDVILGLASKSQWPAADVNDDGNVDVADMNAIINIILGL